MTAQKKAPQPFLETELSSAIELADFREYWCHESSFQSRTITELCNQLAKERGWDLEASMPEAIAQREARFAKEEADRLAERQADEKARYERGVRNYIKKHGQPPPPRPTQADRARALAKLTDAERRALGL